MSSFSLKSKAPKTTVGIADIKVQHSDAGRMVTHALGSCIGLTIFDANAGIVGMLHFMLPEPSPDARHQEPAMFATTGVPALFKGAIDLGASKSKLVVCVAGGSSLMNDKNGFQIGKRNRLILRKMFWKNGINVAAEDSGGSCARTMSIDMTTGQVFIRSQGQEKVLWAA